MTAPKCRLLKFANKHRAIEQLAAQMLPAINDKTTDKTLVLTDGNTCRPLYQRLAEAQNDWSHLTILPSDERFVPWQYERCNGAMIDRLLPDSAKVVDLADGAVQDLNSRTDALNAQQWDKILPVTWSLLGLVPQIINTFKFDQYLNGCSLPVD